MERKPEGEGGQDINEATASKADIYRCESGAETASMARVECAPLVPVYPCTCIVRWMVAAVGGEVT